MFHPISDVLRAFKDELPPSGDYVLHDVSVTIPDAFTAVFKATLRGPAQALVWARAWVSNPVDGTLSEAASPPMNVGEEVVLIVRLTDGRIPATAFMRIESAPLVSEHVVSADLPQPRELTER